MKMIGWIALAITATILAAIAWRVDDWSRDWTENTAQLSDDASQPELRPVRWDGSAEQAESRICSWVETKRNWQVIGPQDQDAIPDSQPTSDDQQSEKNRTLHLTRSTSVFRFVDDLFVTIIPNPNGNGCRIEATSESRLGKGDLGQNPRNLIELTKGITPPLK